MITPRLLCGQQSPCPDTTVLLRRPRAEFPSSIRLGPSLLLPIVEIIVVLHRTGRIARDRQVNNLGLRLDLGQSRLTLTLRKLVRRLTQ